MSRVRCVHRTHRYLHTHTHHNKHAYNLYASRVECAYCLVYIIEFELHSSDHAKRHNNNNNILYRLSRSYNNNIIARKRKAPTLGHLCVRRRSRHAGAYITSISVYSHRCALRDGAHSHTSPTCRNLRRY